MILTGKAKEDFLNYCFINKDRFFDRLLSCEQDVLDELFYLSNTCKNALIIEWFDSVGIYIGIDVLNFKELKVKTSFKSYVDGDCVFGDYGFIYFYSRQEATEQAIKKANEIYNTK